jgi:hypothetical protein
VVRVPRVIIVVPVTINIGIQRDLQHVGMNLAMVKMLFVLDTLRVIDVALETGITAINGSEISANES